jgi:hypothetical protein
VTGSEVTADQLADIHPLTRAAWSYFIDTTECALDPQGAAASVSAMLSRIAALDAALAAVRAERDEAIGGLASALERTERNFRLAIAGKPVRDMCKNLAENAAALAAAVGQPEPTEQGDSHADQ